MAQPPIPTPLAPLSRSSSDLLRCLSKMLGSPLPSNLAVVALLTLLFATYHATRFLKRQQVKRKWRISERVRRELEEKEANSSGAKRAALSSSTATPAGTVPLGSSASGSDQRVGRTELGAKKRKKSKLAGAPNASDRASANVSVAPSGSSSTSTQPQDDLFSTSISRSTRPPQPTLINTSLQHDDSNSAFQVVVSPTSKRRNKPSRSSASPYQSSTPTTPSGSRSREPSTDPSSSQVSTENSGSLSRSTTSSNSETNAGQDEDFPVSSQTTPSTSISSSTISLSLHSSSLQPSSTISPKKLSLANPSSERVHPDSSLDLELETLRASLSTTLSTLSTTQTTLTSTQASLLHSQDELATLTIEKNTLTQSLASTRAELDQIEVAIGASESRAAAAEEMRVQSEADIEEMRKEVERAKREVEDGRRWGEERKKESEDSRRREKAGRREIEKFKEEGRKWDAYAREFRRREYELQFQLHHLSTIHTTLLHHTRTLEAHLREANYAFSPLSPQTPNPLSFSSPVSSNGYPGVPPMVLTPGVHPPLPTPSPSPSSTSNSTRARSPQTHMGSLAGAASPAPKPPTTTPSRGTARRRTSTASSSSSSHPYHHRVPYPQPPRQPGDPSSDGVTMDVLTSILKTSSSLHSGLTPPPRTPPPLLASTSSFLGHPSAEPETIEPTNEPGGSKSDSVEDTNQEEGAAEESDHEISFASITSYDANESPLARQDEDEERTPLAVS